jgi:hypothetical protein
LLYEFFKYLFIFLVECCEKKDMYQPLIFHWWGSKLLSSFFVTGMMRIGFGESTIILGKYDHDLTGLPHWNHGY